MRQRRRMHQVVRALEARRAIRVREVDLDLGEEEGCLLVSFDLGFLGFDLAGALEESASTLFPLLSALLAPPT